MKALRTLLLGSAGAVMLFVTGSVAQAADSPEAVKGREPVWRCDTAGFIEYPGSDWCFKVGIDSVTFWMGGTEDQVKTGDKGFDVFDIWHDGHTHDTEGGFGGNDEHAEPLPTGHFDDDTFWMSVWARPYFDVRRATELGIVRLFADFQINEDAGIAGRHAFIQIGNWLLGNTTTVFYQSIGRVDLFDEGFGAPGRASPGRVVQVRYTFNAGNGVTVIVALQDPAGRDEFIDSDWDTIADGRNEAPDFAANASVKGSWGALGANVLVHQHSFKVTDGPFAGTDVTSDREIGWAAWLGGEVNLGPNDTLLVAVAYSDGLASALSTGAAGDLGIRDGTSYEGVVSWSVSGGWEHQWSPTFGSVLAAGYAENDYGSIDPDMCSHGAGDCGWASGLHEGILEAVAVWGSLIWSPVENLDLGVTVMWGQNDRVIFHNGSVSVETSDAIGAGFTATVGY